MSHNPMDYETDEIGEGEGQSVVGLGGPPVNLSDMTIAERINFLQRTGANMGKSRILEPDAVKVPPHEHGHPVGIINKRDPLNSDNIVSYKPDTGAYGQTDSSIEAGHQFVDIFHSLTQPAPTDGIIYTARKVPDSILARQVRMDADLQGRNPVNQLLDPNNPLSPHVPARGNRGSSRGRGRGNSTPGQGGRGRSHDRGLGRGRGRRGRGRGYRHRPYDGAPREENQGEERIKLNNDMDDYFGRPHDSAPGQPGNSGNDGGAYDQFIDG